MTLFGIRVVPFLLILSAIPANAAAQDAPWTSVLRGSWVRTGPPAAGDVTLAANRSTARIVVSDDESTAVHQAAEFLAGDIEKISGHRPEIGTASAASLSNIHLVTLGHAAIPDAVDVRAVQGQWEIYLIVTADRDVWLIGSNSRGTA